LLTSIITMQLKMVTQSYLKNSISVYLSQQLIGCFNVLVTMLINRPLLKSMIFMKPIQRKQYILNQS